MRLALALVATPLVMAASWPPLLVIHGDADAVVSPQNGLAAVQLWAAAAGARAGTARSVQRGQRPDVGDGLQAQGQNGRHAGCSEPAGACMERRRREQALQ